MATKKSSPNRAERRKQARNRKRLGIIMLVIAIPIAIGLILFSMPPKSPQKPSGPQFTKEGVLSFVDQETGTNIRTIDIEVKDNDYERAEGMMWRKSMEDTQGMLFIMEGLEPRSFWMRNTYIPLDIIFVDENNAIVNIRENAPPQTLDPQTSTGPAKYVVEVIGGFCAQFGISAGDRIDFKIDQ